MSKRLPIQVECGICKRWQSDRELGIGDKDRRWIKRKVVRCRLCLLVENQMAWDYIEKLRKGEEREENWEKLKDYNKKEVSNRTEYEKAEEILCEEEIKENWSKIWEWRNVIKDYENTRRKNEGEGQRKETEKDKDRGDTKDINKENRDCQVKEKEGQKEENGRKRKILEDGTGDVKRLMDKYETDMQGGSCETLGEEEEEIDDRDVNMNVKDSIIVQERVRQEMRIISYEISKGGESEVDNLNTKISSSISRGGMRGRRKISIGKGEIVQETVMEAYLEEKENKKEVLGKHVTHKNKEEEEKEMMQDKTRKKWEEKGARPKERKEEVPTESEEQRKDIDSRIKEERNKRQKIEEWKTQRSERNKEEGLEVEEVKEKESRERETKKEILKLKERKRQQEEKLNIIEKDIVKPEEKMESQKNQEESWKILNRKIQEQKVVAVGDSMLKNLWLPLATTDGRTKPKRNRIISYVPGANINNIMETVKNLEMGPNGGVIVIQGGGNGLAWEGAEETWEKIKKGISEVWKREEEVSVIVVGVTMRTGQSREFENQRRRLNWMMQKQISNWQNKKEEPNLIYRKGVFFLDMDKVIMEKDVSKDGVHPTEEGYDKMYGAIAEEVDMLVRMRIEIYKEIKGRHNRKSPTRSRRNSLDEENSPREGGNNGFKEMTFLGKERIKEQNGKIARDFWVGNRR